MSFDKIFILGITGDSILNISSQVICIYHTIAEHLQDFHQHGLFVIGQPECHKFAVGIGIISPLAGLGDRGQAGVPLRSQLPPTPGGVSIHRSILSW